MLRQFDTLALHLLKIPRKPLVGCVFVEGSSHILEWSKAPYKIFAAGQRTDWELEIAKVNSERKLLAGLQGPLEETDRLRIVLQINPKTITQSPQPLPPVVRRLGDGECLLTFWGAKQYGPVE